MDKFLLEYEIRKNGFTKESFCEAIGISRSSFYKKCNGITEFKQSEIQKIVSVLKLNSPDTIFFAEEVS